MYEALEKALANGDPSAVQEAIFNLGALAQRQKVVPDEVAFYVIDVLRRDSMKASNLGGHVLNFFEFEAPYLSFKAKERCRAFLREYGDEFSDIFSMQVVAELREGEYLVQ